MDELDGDTCGAALAVLRRQREDLIPAPDESLDDTVSQWVEQAEELVFDCEPELYRDQIDQLQVLEEAIDAGVSSL